MEKFNGTLLRVLLAAIPLVGIGWILAVTDYFGIALTFQQVIAVILGVACGAALLKYPYFDKAGIFEFVLAVVAFFSWFWMAYNFEEWVISGDELGIDKWVGSLEIGKDADLALWTSNPLDYRTKCEQTWIDGVLYHELNKTREREKRRAKERDALVAKARNSLDGGKEEKASQKSKEKFFQHCLETACDLFPHSCRTNGHQHQKANL